MTRTLLLLALLVPAGCGSSGSLFQRTDESTDAGADGGADAGSSDAGSDAGSLPVECATLAYCGCLAEEGCKPVAESNFCACGFACNPTDPVCDCALPTGGFACVAVDCPDVTCAFDETLVIGEDGCASCEAPPPCEGRDYCTCMADERCEPLTDSCICPCDYQCPGFEQCQCACGGGDYLGCATRP